VEQPVNPVRRRALRILRLSIYILVLTVAILVAFLVLPATVQYKVGERYLFTASSPDVPVYLAVMLPPDGPYQTISDFGMVGDSRAGVQNWGPVNVVLMEALTGLDSNNELLISYRVSLSQGRARWIAPLEDGYLQAQGGIETDDPRLVTQARELVAGQSEDDAYQIYSFVADHLSWPEGSRMDIEPSALTAYQTGIGGCGEFAYLMTALCRAAGIPAASITGLSMPWGPPLLTQRATWSHPGSAHAWVEVFTGEHWTFADPSWASQFPWHGLWFGYTHGSHLSYGEVAAHDEVYDDILGWAETQGEIIGAMSAPLKFVAATRGDEVSIVPTVTVKKTWDGRWFHGVAVFVAVTVGLALLEDRIRQARSGQL
jgi:hypothetical protein